MKVFNVSPHKSGTRSFHIFCQMHELRSQHWCGEEFESKLQQLCGSVHYAQPLADWNKLNQSYQDLTDKLHLELRDFYTNNDVFSDFPTPILYSMLSNMELPQHDKKFVMILRDVNDWVKSVRNHKGYEKLTYLEQIFYGKITAKYHTTMPQYTDEELIKGYYLFTSNAINCLCQRGLFIGHISDPRLGERLARFIGFEQQFLFPLEA